MEKNDSPLARILASAAKLQEIVPDLVLVGGSAAALHAGHRESFDHDHVLADLTDRYEAILEAVETTEGWATSVRASKPPVTLLGSLDGIPGGIRQLRRSKPLDVESWELPDGQSIRVPTIAEILRIKAFLIIDRGAVRDFVDVVALTERMGIDNAAETLGKIDEYYVVRSSEPGGVLHQLVLALASPAPKDSDVIDQLDRYKGLAPVWQDWATVVEHCENLSRALSEAR